MALLWSAYHSSLFLRGSAETISYLPLKYVTLFVNPIGLWAFNTRDPNRRAFWIGSFLGSHFSVSSWPTADQKGPCEVQGIHLGSEGFPRRVGSHLCKNLTTLTANFHGTVFLRREFVGREEARRLWGPTKIHADPLSCFEQRVSSFTSVTLSFQTA
jgi:hypothetical protein